eukprot:Gregarina_sp_Poly_1__1099@NODE_1269_length_4530_cov_972_447233_g864_i0_p3_GENE_NODE_1269_length_4530_cov_972_447233_g864_i0NODE_1269_length_4530_cov_972_447233_g864_i0_p3_ORF_typecomplete_len199_score32_59_NODE_1269_length_4530_cov_972_447233_g864_i018662462
MMPLDHRDAESTEDGADMDDAMVATHNIGDGVRSLRVVENVALVCTDTEQFVALRIPVLQPNSQISGDLEAVRLSALIRDHPFFKPSESTEDVVSRAALVTSFYVSRTGRAFLLASGMDGCLALFHIGGDKETQFELVSTFTDPNGAHTVGHKDLVRGAEFLLNTIVTVGDDGYVCAWSQSDAVKDLGRRPAIRRAPY